MDIIKRKYLSIYITIFIVKFSYHATSSSYHDHMLSLSLNIITIVTYLPNKFFTDVNIFMNKYTVT